MSAVVDPARGEVWSVRFDPTVGQEMFKTRPAVVVNVPDVGIYDLCIVVPLTSWDPRYEDMIWMTPIPSTTANGLSKDSAADAFQVKSVSYLRFQQKLGFLTDEQVENIAAAVAICVGY